MIGQNLAAGQKIPRKSEIRLTVSSGKRQPENVDDSVPRKLYTITVGPLDLPGSTNVRVELLDADGARPVRVLERNRVREAEGLRLLRVRAGGEDDRAEEREGGAEGREHGRSLRRGGSPGRPGWAGNGSGWGNGDECRNRISYFRGPGRVDGVRCNPLLHARLTR